VLQWEAVRQQTRHAHGVGRGSQHDTPVVSNARCVRVEPSFLVACSFTPTIEFATRRLHEVDPPNAITRRRRWQSDDGRGGASRWGNNVVNVGGWFPPRCRLAVDVAAELDHILIPFHAVTRCFHDHGLEQTHPR
jgi:hypothetical protein